MTDGPLPRDDAPCEDLPRPGDGTQSWLGVVIIAACALVTAGLLGVAAWRLL